MDFFHLDVRHTDGGVLVRLSGELDIGASDLVRRELRSLVHRYDCGQVTFDCTDLTFVDTTGLLALVDSVRAMDQVGKPTLLHPSPPVGRVVQLVGLADLFDIRPAVSEDRTAAPTGVRAEPRRNHPAHDIRVAAAS